MLNDTTEQDFPMVGGLVLAGEHNAYAQSLLPFADDALRNVGRLEQAAADGIVTEQEIESYEVSTATDGDAITDSRQPEHIGKQKTLMWRMTALSPCQRSSVECASNAFGLDVFLPDFTFDWQTTSTSGAVNWMQPD